MDFFCGRPLYSVYVRGHNNIAYVCMLAIKWRHDATYRRSRDKLAPFSQCDSSGRKLRLKKIRPGGFYTMQFNFCRTHLWPLRTFHLMQRVRATVATASRHYVTHHFVRRSSAVGFFPKFVTVSGSNKFPRVIRRPPIDWRIVRTTAKAKDDDADSAAELSLSQSRYASDACPPAVTCTSLFQTCDIDSISRPVRQLYTIDWWI